MAHMVKSLSAMRETQVQSLGWEDPPGEGNGNLLQYSCLENPKDRAAWRATVHGAKKESDTTELLTFIHKSWKIYGWPYTLYNQINTLCHNFEDFNVLNAGPAMGPILCKERLLVNFWVTKC